MTVNIVGDSTWSTTDVTTENANTVLYINGSSSTVDKIIYLTLNNYEPGNHAYIIKNTGATSNVNASQAQYIKNDTEEFAYSGQIVTTGTTTKVIVGTFDFTTSNAHVTGTFNAPLP